MNYLIEYKPRFHQHQIHQKIEGHRFSILVCHRRFGKTILAVNHLIKKATENRLREPQYCYLAPFLKQAKLIAWAALKHYSSFIPGVEIHEGELYIKYPNGARIYLFGADNPDALRGLYLDGVVFDEYAQMKKEVFTEIVRPALSDRMGWALFIGTPQGLNQFYEIYTTAIKQMQVGDQDWYAACYRADETHVISDEELEKLRATLNDAEFRQEMLCDFSSVANDILISIDLVSEAAGRHYGDHELIHAPCIMGVDPARFGDDSSVIIWRQGLQCFEPKIFRKIDNMALVGEITRLIGFMKPDAVFIDAGGGQGIIDRLRQLGYTIQEVNFGGQATRATYYKNKRIEMWDSMKKWMQQGGALPNTPDLKEELVVPTYSFDTANRMQLEPKDKMKERFGKSPDIADALALTFALPVASRERVQALPQSAIVG